ncbi:TOPRIM nucleotidyl transferase/hydrolase domain-containing protein [Bradyrhizobium ganzhouense]|uniref:TOPRIM nucleotidyl transferase/hydrolase domain-containing protein n=1 Tax=Bradyrhizobium ganzhouense TaxID=1179767 RepID=UPI003CFB14B2
MTQRFEDIIEREAFRVCPLLPASNFISFCCNRNLKVDAERLRQLERVGLFLPLLRIYRIDITRKIKLLDGVQRFSYMDYLPKDEPWDGDVRVELADFDFSRRVIRSWLEHGNAWDPRDRAALHRATIDTEMRRHEAYYSQFQIFELDRLLRSMTGTVELEWALREDGSIDPEWGDQLGPNLATAATHMAGTDRTSDSMVGTLCQIISDRYYPRTQGDEREISVPTRISHSLDWDWYAFARQWDAAGIARSLGLDKAELKRHYENVFRYCRQLDPLENWRILVRFVRLEKRQRLKDDALKARSFDEMAKMLRLFYADAFGEQLDPDEDLGRTLIDRIPDIRVQDDPRRALELVVNDFRLNPKPDLVLFVEGPTELAIVPHLIDKMYATSLSVLGIEMVNLRGVGNATGGKDSSYSALWRLIDYLHHHQTIAFVLLDNEGLVPVNIGKGLRIAHSIHSKNRHVTRPDYVKLWKLCFELDNFNDTELAKALTIYAAGQARFTVFDVKPCRESAREPKRKGKLRTLNVLYEERTGLELNKPLFGKVLFDLMVDPAARRKPQHRPIVRFLEKVVERAARNPQPITQAMWEYNQLTGYFGKLHPGAVTKRKPPFSLHKRRAK